MQSLLFDHLFSACRNGDLRASLEEFRAMGFIVDDDVTHHVFGNYSGFVLFSGTYLELLEIYDPAKWNPEKDPDVEAALEANRPYGIGVRCQDAAAVARALRARHPGAPDMFETGRKDDPDPSPIWRFALFPKGSLAGIDAFALQYLRQPTERSKIKKRIAPNGTFGIGGYVFCASNPAERMRAWRETLEEISPVEKAGNALRIGAQRFEWITPTEYASRFGVAWKNVGSIFGELAAVKLLTQDLPRTLDALAGAGVNRETARVPPLANTGFAFEIEAGDAEEFFRRLPMR